MSNEQSLIACSHTIEQNRPTKLTRLVVAVVLVFVPVLVVVDDDVVAENP
jgi:hypothetical protein